jgi:tRNA(Ile)-lysidine synthase
VRVAASDRAGQARYDPRMALVEERTGQLRAVARRVRRTLDDARATLVGRRVLALCSGGADSVLLVAALDALPRGARPASLDVLWCDHAMRDDVDSERAAARAAAERVGARFHARRAESDLATAAGGVEGAARTWRYEVAAELAAEFACDVVVTGHTASDQLESALLALVGVTGRAGDVDAMPVARELAPGIELVRPLLGLARSEVERACADAELAWANDPTNADPDAFARNAVRHRVVPQLLELHPGAGAALVRAAERSRERAHVMRSLADSLLDAWDGGDRLEVEQLEFLPLAARREVVARWLARAGLGRGVTQRVVAAVTDLVGSSVGAVDLPRNACVRCDGYHLQITARPRHGGPRP